MKNIFDETTQKRVDDLLDQRSLHKKKLDQIDAELHEIQDYDPDYFKVEVPAFAQNKEKFEKIKEIYVEQSTINQIDNALTKEINFFQ